MVSITREAHFLSALDSFLPTTPPKTKTQSRLQGLDRQSGTWILVPGWSQIS